MKLASIGDRVLGDEGRSQFDMEFRQSDFVSGDWWSQLWCGE